MDPNTTSQILAWAKDVAMTIAGITLAVIPLALWASPTLTIFYTVLSTCAVSCGVVLLLSRFEPDAPSREQRSDGRVRVPPALLHHLQNQRELGREDLPELRRFVQDTSARPSNYDPSKRVPDHARRKPDSAP